MLQALTNGNTHTHIYAHSECQHAITVKSDTAAPCTDTQRRGGGGPADNVHCVALMIIKEHKGQ